MAGVHQVVIKGTVFGQTYNVVRYWNAALATPNYQDFVNRLGAAFKSALQPLVHDAVTFSKIYVRPVVEGSIGIELTPEEFPFTGDRSASIALPNHDAVRITYTGAALEYPYKGYNRLSGITEDQVASGNITGPALTDWQSVAQALGQNYGLTNLFTAVLWSDEYQRSQEIVGSSVAVQISTQRSRRLGVGA